MAPHLTPETPLPRSQSQRLPALSSPHPGAPWLGLRSDLGPWCPPPAAGGTEAGPQGLASLNTCGARPWPAEGTVRTPALEPPKPSLHPRPVPSPRTSLEPLQILPDRNLVSRWARNFHSGHQGVQTPRPLPFGGQLERGVPNPPLPSACPPSPRPHPPTPALQPGLTPIPAPVPSQPRGKETVNTSLLALGT